MLSQPRTFRCPNCNEMINDSMTQCRYCGVPVDPGIAAVVADRQEKTNQACNDASFLRTVAIAMLVFLGISFIPFVPFAYWGFLITFVLALVLLIKWQAKFANLITNDTDYVQAKRSKNISFLLLLAAAPLGFVVRPLLDLILAQLL